MSKNVSRRDIFENSPLWRRWCRGVISERGPRLDAARRVGSQRDPTRTQHFSDTVPGLGSVGLIFVWSTEVTSRLRGGTRGYVVPYLPESSDNRFPGLEPFDEYKFGVSFWVRKLEARTHETIPPETEIY